MNRLIIIGASGHGKVVAEIAEKCGYNEIIFLDDDRSLTQCAGWPVVGDSSSAGTGDLFIAIGNAESRKRLMVFYQDRRIVTLIHPSAVISKSAKIEAGTVVMPGVVINSDAHIGKGVIVNTSSSVDHDCVIGDFAHIAVGAHLCGTVTIGEGTWVGAGVTVSNNVNICGGCTIGAGAVVIKDISKPGVFVGVPATQIK